MSNIVKFLETLGQNPEIVSDAEFADAVATAPVSGDVKQALLSRDAAKVEAAAGARGILLSFLVPAEEEVPDDGETEKDVPEEKEPESQVA
jgi:hypothetical protein